VTERARQPLGGRPSEVGYLDIGDAVVIVPGGVAQLRRTLLDAVSDADWDEARAGFGDPELANE